MRPSNPALLAASRTLFEQRGQLVTDWAALLSDRAAGTRTVPAELMRRHLRLMVDLVAEMAGPMRREARELWEKACEHYGRTAAARGLVAGEVADEFSALREILTRDLAEGGVPSAGNGLETADVERQLGALERELLAVTAPPPGGM